MRRLPLALIVTVLVSGAPVPVMAATITIINKDGAGVGLNDPTAAAPVGGNPGTTIGAQRLNVFKEAARIWGQILPSSVEIKVDASFKALSCNATSAILGSAGPVEVFSDFSGAPFPGTWYVVALANKLSGLDQDPSLSDISAQFNKNLGSSGCLTGVFFYYGFDANQGSNISFLTVALHEFGHGLGFLTVADDSTGAFLGGTPDIFARYIFDNTAGKTWTQMATDVERKASAINAGKVAWSGTSTTAAASKYLSKKPFLYVTAPPVVAGTLDVGTASFGAALTSTGVSGSLVAALDPADGSGPSTFDACSALTNGAQVSGKIALIDRGTCAFTVKAKNGQNAGAIGVVIANNVAGAPPALAGTDATITIPVVSVSQSDGANLRVNLPASVKIALDPVARAGADSAGRVLLYTPSVLEPGSSVSHFDTSASPNLLMEPAINDDLPIGLDITPPLFRDIGWTVIPPPRGDFNGDFYSDIVWRNTANGLNALWLMNGASFSSILNLPALPNTNYVIGGIGDFNGDGKPDILWRNMTTGQNAVWLMSGANLLSIVDLPGLPNTNYVIGGVGDFDGDGKPDILWRNMTNGNNAVWLMNGTSFGSIVNLAALPNTNYVIGGVGDFDGDGKPDILWRNMTNGNNAVWLMNGTSLGSIVNLPALPNTNYVIGGVGDFDGDGKADIAWRNMSTGQNAVWLMNGTSFVSIVNLPGLPNVSYRMSGPK